MDEDFRGEAVNPDRCRKMRTEVLDDGIAICGDATSQEVIERVSSILNGHDLLIVTDPPYGRIVSEVWDQENAGSQQEFANWMIDWTRKYGALLSEGGAMYVWGGYGVPGFRPFFEYCSRVEAETPLRLANFLTWSKKRAYGVQNNYLATREELAYLVNGDPKKPALFNVPYLREKRSYAGYNAKYPAKSEFYRRTNVWMDVTELLRGKEHPTQKPVRVYEIPIEIHTREGSTVLDPFAGSMTAAWAARRLNCRWVCVERDEFIFEKAVKSLRCDSRSR